MEEEHKKQKAIEDALFFLVGKGNKYDLEHILKNGVNISKEIWTRLIEISCERNDDKMIRLLIKYRGIAYGEEPKITQEEKNVMKAWANYHGDDYPNLLSLLCDDI